MIHKRYARRNGTSYVGKREGKSAKAVLFYLLITLGVVGVVFFVFFYNVSPLENISFNVQDRYREGEIITGRLELTAKERRLIPPDASVVISFDGVERELLLRDVADFEIVEDDSIEGETTFEEETFPKISFQLRIFEFVEDETETLLGGGSQSDILESPEDEEEKEGSGGLGTDSSGGEGDTGDTGESGGRDDGSSIGDASGGGATTTGSVIFVEEFFVSGIARKGDDFTYNLREGQLVEIVEGSVRIEGVKADEANLILKVDDNVASVSTIRSFKKRFGRDSLTINLDKFEFIFRGNAILEARVVYENNVLAETERNIMLVGEFSENERGLEEGKVQFDAVLGEPVKWVESREVEGPTTIIFEIPASAENIVIRKFMREKRFGNLKIDYIERHFGRGTGFSFFAFSITGMAFGDTQEIVVEVGAIEDFVEIEYWTPAPEIVEEKIDGGKRVRISAPDVIYKNVFVFTEIPAGFDIDSEEQVIILWIGQEGEVLDKSLVDSDGDGYYDMLEWIVPVLAVEEFDILVNVRMDNLGSKPILVSDYGTNKTSERVHCLARLSGFQGSSARVDWRRDSEVYSSVEYSIDNDNYLIDAILSVDDTEKGQVWSCELSISEDGEFVRLGESGVLKILNSLPNVELVAPDVGEIVEEKTPTFFWLGADEDMESLNYEFDISLVSDSCLDSGENVKDLSEQSYTLSSPLFCLYDNLDYYIWKVRANDKEGVGEWSEERKVGIYSLVSIESLVVGKFDLGEVVDLQVLVENKGEESLENVFVNLLIFDSGKIVSTTDSSVEELMTSGRNSFTINWDTSGFVEGEYDVKLIVNYADDSFEKDIVFEVEEDNLVVRGIGYSVRGGELDDKMVWLVVVLVVIILANILWFVFFKKKRKEKKR